ncbi:MAG: polysaccharide pyruvyl transferase family protein [Caldicoprobacterales bacterium]|jgi:polysaccharide pyruvyl transferase WcaK-like protein
MNVLVIGERFSSNLGDPIICESVEFLIHKHFPNAKITFADISGRDSFIEPKNTDTQIIQGRLSSIKKKISLTFTKMGVDTEYIKFRKAHKRIENFIYEACNQDFDLAIFAGGQLFKDTFVLPINDFVSHLSSRNIPIIFNACGVGEIASIKMRSILANALCDPSVKVITSRDDIQTINKEFLLNTSRKAVRTHDPALWAGQVYGVQKRQSDTVGLGIMFAHNMNYNDMITFWTNIVKELNLRNIKWKFFCNGSIKDHIFAADILKKMGCSDSEKEKLLLPRPVRPVDLVKMIASFNSIISFRLHSHIIAYALDIPGIAIVWDEKLKHFYRSIHLESRCKNLNTNIKNIIMEMKKAKDTGYNERLRESQTKETKDLLISAIMETIE